MNDFFLKKSITWIKVSKPWDNPFAERGIRTIKHEYVNQMWIRNFSEFEELSEIINQITTNAVLINLLIIKRRQRSELQQQATTRNIHLPEKSVYTG